jgi:hypothetical protein
VTAPDAPAIAVAGESDLPDLLALMRAYCDFYAVTPGGGRRPARPGSRS